MGKTCVAANCTNRCGTTENVSFHTFPNREKDEVRHKQWVLQVQRTRADWKGPTSVHSFVCSDHFTEDSFEITHRFMKDMGIKTAKRLKCDAIPTIFPRAKYDETTKPKRKRKAFEKREKQRLLADAFSEAAHSAIVDAEMDIDMEHDRTPKFISAACQTELQQKHKKVQVVMKHGSDKRVQTGFSHCTTQNQCIQVGDGNVQIYQCATSENSMSEESDMEKEGSTYFPSIESEDEAASEDFHFSPEKSRSDQDVLTEPKFIVFWSALLMLLRWVHCP